VIPFSQLEEMNQHIDASAEETIKNRLRIKADAEFEKELYQLIEAGVSETEISKKIENVVAEKIKE